jgi:leader peptidase (prepilin peptidase)/N-methyltransferase
MLDGGKSPGSGDEKSPGEGFERKREKTFVERREMMDGGAVSLLVLILGLCVGSFLNVCIFRMPREESIVSPGSRCPSCRKPVAWYDNIPLVSYLALGGKCRDCRQRISPRYFFVELCTGFLGYYLWRRYGCSWEFAAAALLFPVLLAVAMTDLETGFIPDKLTFFGGVAGLTLSGLAPALMGQSAWYGGLLQAGLGLLAGGGILVAIGYLGNAIFRKETMGGGDIKLLAMVGTFIGWKEVIFVFLFAPILAAPFALYAKFARKAETIPFGPYLAVTGALFYLFGDRIMAYFYLS